MQSTNSKINLRKFIEVFTFVKKNPRKTYKISIQKKKIHAKINPAKINLEN